MSWWDIVFSTHVCKCTCASVHVCMHMCGCAHVYVCMHACLHVCMHMYKNACVCICVSVHVCMNAACVCACICVCTCMYVYACLLQCVLAYVHTNEKQRIPDEPLFLPSSEHFGMVSDSAHAQLCMKIAHTFSWSIIELYRAVIPASVLSSYRQWRVCTERLYRHPFGLQSQLQL